MTLVGAADGPDAPDGQLLAAIEREVAPSDDAVVVYTSGQHRAAEGRGPQAVDARAPSAGARQEFRAHERAIG